MVELPDRASGSGNRLTPHVDFGLNGLGFLFRASGPKMGLTSSPWQEYGGLSAFRAKPVGVCHSLACCLVGRILLASATLPSTSTRADFGPSLPHAHPFHLTQINFTNPSTHHRICYTAESAKLPGSINLWSKSGVR